MATQEELAAKLNTIGDELDKAQAEIVASIQALPREQPHQQLTLPWHDWKAAPKRWMTSTQT